MKNEIIKIKKKKFIVVKGECQDCCLFDIAPCYRNCDINIPANYCLKPKPTVTLKHVLKKIERFGNEIKELKQPTENKKLINKIKSLEKTLKYYL